MTDKWYGPIGERELHHGVRRRAAHASTTAAADSKMSGSRMTLRVSTSDAFGHPGLTNRRQSRRTESLPIRSLDALVHASVNSSIAPRSQNSSSSSINSSRAPNSFLTTCKWYAVCKFAQQRADWPRACPSSSASSAVLGRAPFTTCEILIGATPIDRASSAWETPSSPGISRRYGPG